METSDFTLGLQNSLSSEPFYRLTQLAFSRAARCYHLAAWNHQKMVFIYQQLVFERPALKL